MSHSSGCHIWFADETALSFRRTGALSVSYCTLQNEVQESDNCWYLKMCITGHGRATIHTLCSFVVKVAHGDVWNLRCQTYRPYTICLPVFERRDNLRRSSVSCFWPFHWSPFRPHWRKGERERDGKLRVLAGCKRVVLTSVVKWRGRYVFRSHVWLS